ncbi:MULTISPECIES: SH3 domain-containing protein [Vibrio]|nr:MULTISPECIES: SH3 domain-containing protein [Vibrio]EGQ7979812.1 hypothetical protein [Vibrio cholerae]EGQ8559304.1 hypothetical protein [Vibrio cholerae]EGR2590922.1 hypothetical protein [Vibrio cholerae]EJL6864376.1 hypothetical protein [Vibrio cholerae]EJL6976464.1 hypothetical protein [Vibrio cholerae]
MEREETMKYKVVKEYFDAPENPIRIEKGEILQFVEESNPEGDWANWVYCKGINKEGWVPKQILEIEGDKVVVLKDYFAREHTLVIGDNVVAEYELNGWIWCEKESMPNVYAWAPINHLAKG